MSFDTRDLDAFAAELSKMGPETHKRVRGVYQSAAQDLKNEWRKNAEATSGTHAWRYPLSIDWEEKVSTSLEFEVGPNESKPQGKLGDELEFGTATSPPHLDGQLAADRIIPLLGRRVALAAEDVFGA